MGFFSGGKKPAKNEIVEIKKKGKKSGQGIVVSPGTGHSVVQSGNTVSTASNDDIEPLMRPE